MKSLKIFLIGLFVSSALLALLSVFKPAQAMVPPPASHAWLMGLFGPAESKNVTVEVKWNEGAREEKVILKTYLKDVR